MRHRRRKERGPAKRPQAELVGWKEVGGEGSRTSEGWAGLGWAGRGGRGGARAAGSGRQERDLLPAQPSRLRVPEQPARRWR